MGARVVRPGSRAIPQTKARLGFLPESPYFYDYLTSREFLGFYGHLFGLWGAVLDKRIDELLELVGMTHAKDLQLRKFSKACCSVWGCPSLD